MKQVLLLAILLAFQVGLTAQNEFKMTEETRSMEKTSANCLVITYPKATGKQISGIWSSYIKKYDGKSTYNKKISEYFLDNTTIKEMSENTVDITAKIYDKGANGAEIAIWFNLGVTYLSSKDYPDRFPAADAFLRKFDAMVFADLAKQQLKDEQKKLVALQKELKNLGKASKSDLKNIEKQKKIIAKAEQSIQESEQKIAETVKAEDKKKVEITTQEQVIIDIKAKIKGK